MNEIEQLISLHEKLIYKLATKFHDIDKEDLYQAGVIGIIKAYKNYQQNQNTKFTSYAYNYIFGEMYEFANNMRSIKLNKNILKLYKKIEQAKFHLAQKLNAYPTTTQIATFLNIDETLISEIESYTASIMSLDTESERPIYETVTDIKDNINPLNIDLKDSLDTLTNQEKQIIDCRYFKDLTQSETAKLLGMSQVTVSRYEKKSLTKMYNYLSI